MNRYQRNALRGFAIVASVPFMIAILAALLLAGCQTNNTLDHTSIPAGYEQDSEAGLRDAVQWFKGKYGHEPKTPHYQINVLPDARINGWAHTVSAWRIEIRGTCPREAWRAVFSHEHRHRLNKANGKLDTEETVR